MKGGWLYIIAPFKFLGALITTLSIILAVDLYRHIGASIVFSLIMAGNMLASIIFGKYLFNSKRKGFLIVLGFVGTLFSTSIILKADSIELLSLAVFIYSLLSNSTYFASLSILSDLKKYELVGRIEEIGGWAWVLGLFFGAFAVKILGMQAVLQLLVIFSVLSLIYSIYILDVIRAKIIKAEIRKRRKKIKIEESGLLILLEKGLEIFEKEVDVVARKVSASMHSIVRSPYMLPFTHMKVSLPKKNLDIHITFFALFLSFGIVFSQIVAFMKDKGIENSTIFIFSLVSSILSAMFYKKAVNVYDIRGFVGIRLLMLVVLVISILAHGYYFTILMLLFYLLNGYTWAYIVVSPNKMFIEHSKGDLGVNNFFKNLGYAIGGIFSGFIVESAGFLACFVVSFTIILLTYLFGRFTVDSVRKSTGKHLSIPKIFKNLRKINLRKIISFFS